MKYGPPAGASPSRKSLTALHSGADKVGIFNTSSIFALKSATLRLTQQEQNPSYPNFQTTIVVIQV
jgi:hypothetical protein